MCCQSSIQITRLAQICHHTSHLCHCTIKFYSQWNKKQFQIIITEFIHTKIKKNQTAVALPRVRTPYDSTGTIISVSSLRMYDSCTKETWFQKKNGKNTCLNCGTQYNPDLTKRLSCMFSNDGGRRERTPST